MQKIYPETVKISLEKGLQSAYFLVGNDLLLVNETKDLIVQTARDQDFDEKVEITVANDTNWDNLFEQIQSTGLFFSRQIIILNLPENINIAYQKQLQQLAEFVHSDILLIFHLPKFNKTIEKQKWVSVFNGIQINCQTPDQNKLAGWIYHRSQTMNLVLDNEATQLLCYSYEGNLLALKQALQLLELRFSGKTIDVKKVNQIIEQSSQFTPFQWIDALLEGKIKRAIRILSYLKNEDTQPVVLLRIIQKELFTLMELSCNNLQNFDKNRPLIHQNLRVEFDRLKVWQNKRGLYQNIMNRLNYQQLFQLCQTLAELERLVKKEFSDEIWFELERFCLKFK
ncbi:DNA polymerase III subunit delta [Phocoenobacter uteri]|uniref:DNA polymerase III subunit delta n=1 Tax=Phocoenobacter uteri TaxID=146806 RepID=A0A379C815_9PAST|nr:DNA polymerase III subunit delta [Phocoenobacter uteri]MDG6882293.1 DNA polymerase III subunit delta [Phocoenobacter uteri]SUB58450.1 DNA polymerase III subunit delta [Phocoenobacter uteri]